MRTIVHQFNPYIPAQNAILSLQLMPVKAGFPSPADDFIDTKLDLNDYLVKHPASTYFVRVQGNGLKNSGVFSGDMLIVDRSLDPSDQAIIIASLDGELLVKKFRRVGNRTYLVADDVKETIKIEENTNFQVWGVVTSVVHRTR